MSNDRHNAPSNAPEQSSRLRIRCGRLARTEREDPIAELARREPDELFESLSEIPDPMSADAD